MQRVIEEKFTGLIDEILHSLPADNRPQRVVHLVPGNMVVWDGCECGQLSGRLVSLVPVVKQGSTVNKCGIMMWRATGEVTLLRCALTQNDQGVPPSPEALTNEALESICDSDTILSVLTSQDWITGISAWTPQGPNAGCKGIAVTFTFNLDNPS